MLQSGHKDVSARVRGVLTLTRTEKVGGLVGYKVSGVRPAGRPATGAASTCRLRFRVA